MDHTGAAGAWRPTRSSLFSWLLYDLANTTFALGVGSRYFGPWLIEDRGGADWQLSAAIVVAMIAVIVLGPWIGALSDHHGTRKPYLIVSTLVCVSATAVLATWGVGPSLIFYAIATVAFHCGAVVYDAMLPDVSVPATAGRISGTGVAVGYAGSALALGIGVWLLPSGGYAAVFRALAIAFLVFALPAFLWIRERPRARLDGRPPGLLDLPVTMVRAWKAAAEYPGIVRFLIGRFLYTDAINTVFLFNAIFAKFEMGFTDRQTDVLALVGIAAACLGAVIAGRLVDRVGPRFVLNLALYAQLIGLVAAVTSALSGIQGIGWLVAIGGGAGVGAAWASDRVLMTRLAPVHLLGEFFGLYSTVGRFATVVGPLIWALVTDGLGWGRPAAMALLALFIVAARVVLHKVRDEPLVAA